MSLTSPMARAASMNSRKSLNGMTRPFPALFPAVPFHGGNYTHLLAFVPEIKALAVLYAIESRSNQPLQQIWGLIAWAQIPLQNFSNGQRGIQPHIIQGRDRAHLVAKAQ